MLRSKYGFQIICGACLLLFAIPELSFEYSYNVHSIFTYLWVSMTILFVAANWQRMMKLELIERLEKERERRALWLQAQKKHLSTRRRGRVTQPM